MFAIGPGDARGVHEDQHHERIDAALLGEPESELKSRESELVEEVDQEDSTTEGNGKPDRETNRDQAQIVAPVAGFLDGFAPYFAAAARPVPCLRILTAIRSPNSTTSTKPYTNGSMKLPLESQRRCVHAPMAAG